MKPYFVIKKQDGYYTGLGTWDREMPKSRDQRGAYDSQMEAEFVMKNSDSRFKGLDVEIIPVHPPVKQPQQVTQ